MIDKEELRKILPYARVLIGESQESFAKKLGISRCLVTQIENGTCKFTELYARAFDSLIREISHKDERIWPPMMVLYYNTAIGRDKIISLIQLAINKCGRKSGIKRQQKYATAACMTAILDFVKGEKT